MSYKSVTLPQDAARLRILNDRIEMNKREGLLCACNQVRIPYYGTDGRVGTGTNTYGDVLHGYDDCEPLIINPDNRTPTGRRTIVDTIELSKLVTEVLAHHESLSMDSANDRETLRAALVEVLGVQLG